MASDYDKLLERHHREIDALQARLRHEQMTTESYSAALLAMTARHQSELKQAYLNQYN